MKRDFLTIVSGLPRSGTSMMMRILDEGGMPVLIDNLRSPDDDNPNGYYEFEPVKKTRQDTSWLNGSEGKAVKMVYSLLYALPPDRKYRVVFMRRAMAEVLASQKVMLQRNQKQSPGSELSDEEMARLFTQQIHQIMDWLDTQPNFETLYVDFNELVAGPEGPIDEVIAFLGGVWNRDAMLAVVDPTLYRQRAATGKETAI